MPELIVWGVSHLLERNMRTPGDRRDLGSDREKSRRLQRSQIFQRFPGGGGGEGGSRGPSQTEFRWLALDFLLELFVICVI